MVDARFAKLHTDPRFVRPKAAKNKIVVDERFKQLFDDEEVGKKGKGAAGNKVDKYGRPLEAGSTGNELKRYYRMASPGKEEVAEGEGESGDEEEGSGGEEEDGDEDEEEDGDEPATGQKTFVDLARGEGGVESSDEEQESGSDSDDSDSEGSVTLGPSTLRRPARRSPSIDLSETEVATFGDDDDASDADSTASSLDATPSRRLAVVNMDWDHLRAADLYRVLASSLSATAPAAPLPSKAHQKKFDDKGEEVGPYKPPARLVLAQGRLLNLRVYPSMFGRERMEREAREGPPTEVFAAAMAAEREEEDGETMTLGRAKPKPKSKRRGKGKKRGESESESEDEEITEKDIIRDQIEDGAEDYDGEALRKYQLERLRYYYAIATFDSPDAASHVLREINGTEFERTANVFDLQFVPDETSFDDDPVHDEATEASVAAAGPSYQGVDFVTDALRHSKVKLTWDADDPHRKNKITNFLASATDKGKGKGRRDLNEDDIKVYLASDSEDEPEELAEAEDDFFEPVGDESKPKSGAKGRRDQLRSLFGLDSKSGGAEKEWDGGLGGPSKKGGLGGGKDGEMQITFAPALSDALEGKSGKKGKGAAKEEEEETSIESYKKKEKERRERKKAERKARREGGKVDPGEGPEFGTEDVGPGGFDDAFFADGGDGGDDAFSAFDRGDDMDDAAPKKSSAKMSKRERREAKQAEELAAKEGADALSLLVADDDDDNGEGGRHFDMRKILKAEKNKGKKVRKPKGKTAPEEVVKDDFNMDVGDSRFKSLHEDYDFAIDPSNPRFQKTRNMTALLAEGRKRRSKTHDVRAPVGADYVKPRASGEEGESLAKLVESVKRKSEAQAGRGKRSRVE
ncbi:hypothetical protein P7C70_g1241, partial [Phenoliferia sp. Uapishka_3]